MSAAPVRVDLVVRSDAPWKRGGDLMQIEEYAPHLRAAGIDLREVPFHPAMRFRRGAVVHIFNVDRPFDFVIAASRARRHRLVVSPIHHNVHRVRAMRAADRGRGAASLAGRVLPEPAREWLGTVVRSLRHRGQPRSVVLTLGVAARTLPGGADVWRTAGRALDRADAVALLASGEGSDLAELTGWHRRNEVLVPNGRPQTEDSDAFRPWVDRAPGSVIVVGRIEPRKRPLELAQEADRQGVPVLFVGPHVSTTDGYTARFDALAASSPFVSHVDGVDHGEVLRLLGRHRVLLNGSWVEVQSLVDLEAAFSGCAVVASGAGHSREWLGDAVDEVPSGAPADLVASAARRAAEPVGPMSAPQYDWTWARSASVLADLYRG